MWAKRAGALDAVGGSQALFEALFCAGAGGGGGSAASAAADVASPSTTCGARNQSALAGTSAASSSAAGQQSRCGGALEDTFWLDTAAEDRGRFSYMGGRGGALWRRVTYRLPPPSSPLPPAGAAQMDATENGGSSSGAEGAGASGAADNCGASGSASHSATATGPRTAAARDACGEVIEEWADGHVVSSRQPFFEYLERQLAAPGQRLVLDPADPADASNLPFDFWGGFAGYLGYELKAECGGRNAHAAATPDAAMFFADRLIAVDHRCRDVYVLALAPCGEGQCADSASGGAGGIASAGAISGACSGSGGAAQVAAATDGTNGDACGSGQVSSSAATLLAEGWVAATAATIDRLAAAGASASSSGRPARAEQHNGAAAGAAAAPQPFSLRHPKAAYLANVAACRDALFAGDSYEVRFVHRAVNNCPFSRILQGVAAWRGTQSCGDTYEVRMYLPRHAVFLAVPRIPLAACPGALCTIRNIQVATTY